jgi:hypothetical protein
MEFITSRVIPLLITATALVALMGISLAVGNISGKIIKKIFGIGGK